MIPYGTMNKQARTKKSKFLSLVLRHRPERIGIVLDSQGWVPVAQLLERCAASGFSITEEELIEVVTTNPKQRFSFSEDGRRIRANQGHSVQVDLKLEPLAPPPVLYHGTTDKFLPAIKTQGLKRMSRHHVHLSPDRATAVDVGGRRGRPVVLLVDANQMQADGHLFYRSDNNVWLTERVPPEYLTVETE